VVQHPLPGMIGPCPSIHYPTARHDFPLILFSEVSMPGKPHPEFLSIPKNPFAPAGLAFEPPPDQNHLNM